MIFINMDKSELQSCISDGLSSRKIAAKYGLPKNTIYYWLNKHNLKTQFLSYNTSNVSKYEKLNFDEMQKFYDDGNTWRDLKIKYNLSDATIDRFVKQGKLKMRSKADALKLRHQKHGTRKLTDEIKKKISDSRIKYLMENPDKVPYKINHSSKKSWPEQIFENALISSGIDGWTYAFQNGMYEYDFAFVEKKIDVEIDGGTHKLDKVKRIDERRDHFSKSQGWTVIRFEASRVKADVISCIEELKTILNR